jgi:NhaP-type Na+/H+ or K+/H+ antiporter
VDLNSNFIALFSASIIANESDPGLILLNRHRHTKLHNIMFGESLLSDTLSIVLFVTVLEMTGLNDESGQLRDVLDNKFLSVLTGLGMFIGITLASIAFGLFWGIVCTYYFKYFRFMT